MSINGGEPAFPVPEFFQPGMSLRDWFAGQALYAATGFATTMRVANGDTETRVDLRAAATLAYQIADAMLKARERPQQDMP